MKTEKTTKKKKETPQRQFPAVNFDEFAKEIDITGPDGEMDLKLYKWQKNLGLAFQKAAQSKRKNKRGFVCLTPRQSGTTTLLCAYILWYNYANARNAILLTNKFDQSVETMKRIQDMYKSLPDALKKPVQKMNKQVIVFADGTYISTCTALASNLRGRSFDLLVVDDAAHVRNLEEEILCMCLPVICSRPQSQMILASCAAPGVYMKLWEASTKKKSYFENVKVPYNCVPGRDREWKKRMILEHGQKIFDQEYDCKLVVTSKE